jgi:hypothetical protein
VRDVTSTVPRRITTAVARKLVTIANALSKTRQE